MGGALPCLLTFVHSVAALARLPCSVQVIRLHNQESGKIKPSRNKIIKGGNFGKLMQ